MVFQEGRLAAAERLGNTGPHFLRTDEIDRVTINADAIGEDGARLADHAQRPIGGRDGDRIGRMGVDDRMHVGPDAEDFRMNVDFAVARTAAGDLLAFDIAGDDIVHRHLVEAEAVRFHIEEIGFARHADRHMAAREIAEA